MNPRVTTLCALLLFGLAPAAGFAAAPPTPALPGSGSASATMITAPPAATTTSSATTTPAAAAPAAPAPPAGSRAITSIRNKISAGDLHSAESILEVYREKYGADGWYIQALGWVARGALLLGDEARAARYEAELREQCADCLRRGASVVRNDSLETALGAAIEVRAQLLARRDGREAAVRYLDRELTTLPEPVSLRSRVMKRRNILALADAPAPALVAEDWVGAPPPRLEELRGRPVLLYVWSWSCGDCRAQAAALGRIKRRYADRGLQVVALTRFHDTDHAREKAKIDSTWADTYRDMGPTPIVVSTASTERYGGSSTPTFVFIDRAGIVRWYTPTRLTEADLAEAVEELLR